MKYAYGGNTAYEIFYDELDLISNITGDYTDRNYLEWMPIVDSSRHAPIAASQAIRRPLQNDLLSGF